MDNINGKDSLESKDPVTTTFADDGIVAQSSYLSVIESDRLDVKDQGLASFFAKPYVVSQAVWSTTGVQNTNIANIDVWTAYNSVAPWTDKARGYALMRGTVVLRVQINANPFQQGKLLISWQPLNNELGAVSTSAYLHYFHIESKRMLPCVELDCSESSAMITVPYISPASWVDVKTGTYGWGRIQVDVLSPLVVGAAGTTTVDVTTFMHFEDMEFAAPLYPQMSGRGGPKMKYKGRTMTKEEAKMESGPITNALATTSKVAAGLGGVPILSSVMEPLSWATNAASGVAASLGWSKPVTHEAAKLCLCSIIRIWLMLKVWICLIKLR